MVHDGWKYVEYGADLCEPNPFMETEWFARKSATRPGEAIYRPAGLREVFDLGADPRETRNVFAASGERARGLAAELERRLGPSPAQEIVRTMRRIGY